MFWFYTFCKSKENYERGKEITSIYKIYNSNFVSNDESQFPKKQKAFFRTKLFSLDNKYALPL